MGPVGPSKSKGGGTWWRRKETNRDFVLCRVQTTLVGNSYTCKPRFSWSESCHRQFPTAGESGVLVQIGSGADGWMLRAVNLDHNRRRGMPIRHGEEEGSVIIHTRIYL
jgi:hypothetical protein